MVAREHSEPARVDREAIVDAELHREVRHYHAAHLTRQPKRSKRAAAGYNRSMTAASAWPKPMHIVAIP